MSAEGARRRDVTVADVAKAAQVSKAQAARALGNYGAVSDDVRERVLAAAEALSYRPNELARSMNTGKSHTIGVVVGDIENPHFGLATRGITDTAKKAGYNVILVNTDEDREAEVDAVRVLLDKRVDGLIVAPASSVDTGHLQEVHRSGRPMVFIDRTAGDMPVETMAVDMARISREATRYLLDAGHRRIALINIESLESELPAAVGRYDGYRKALEEAGLELDPDLVRFGSGGEEDGYKYTMELMTSGNVPTAIFCANDRGAWGAYQAVSDLRLSIPEDVSIVGFDNQATLAPFLRPGLTTFELPFVAMGRRAVELILQDAEPDGRVELMDCPLIERNSVTHPKEMP
jgi:LacI family transcriptional regulator